MINPQAPIPPKIVWDLTTPVRALEEALGRDRIKELNKPNAWFDWGSLAVTWVTFAGLWYLLVRTPFGFWWCVGGLLQALTIFNSFYNVRHDLFFHRTFPGKRASYVLGVLCSLVLLNPFSEHTKHGDHHKHVGWDLSEEVLMDLDTRWKRWFCLTIVGIAFLMARKLRPADAPRPNEGFVPPLRFVEALKRERWVHLTFNVALVAALLLAPTVVLKGYVLPVVVFGPLVLMMRFVFQHGETDVDNPFHVALYYRNHWLARVLTYNAIGDAHMAHHFFPTIPFYRLGEAASLFHPVVSRHGVVERSFFEALYGFFIEGQAMRSRWVSIGGPASSAAVTDGPDV